VTLAMARCIGRADCPNEPSAGRGLCMTCYQRHRGNGTLDNYPTMRERTAQLRAKRLIDAPNTPTEATKAWRHRKYGERIVVNGVLIHPNAAHGRLHTYNSYGCRGAMCRSAYNYYKGTGTLMLPDDIRGANPTVDDCVNFDSETFLGAYL
jgi:hypothetical protein